MAQITRQLLDLINQFHRYNEVHSIKANKAEIFIPIKLYNKALNELKSIKSKTVRNNLTSREEFTYCGITFFTNLTNDI